MKRAFFGGVHPKGYKELSREAAIVPLHPSVVSVAMSQHIGAPCQPLVKVGDRVTVGQKIGDGQGLCVPVHASVSGTVTAIPSKSQAHRLLICAAEALLSNRFSFFLREELAAGVSFPRARQAALERMGMESGLLVSPNDILGVEFPT